MHEMAICQGILDIALSEAAKYQATAVKEIRLKIGAYSGAVPALIQEYFNIISADTIAKAANIKVEIMPVIAQCRICAKQSTLERFKIRCAHCNSQDLTIISGREFYIDSLEVE